MVETWSSLSPTRLITGAGGGFSSGTVSVSILLSSPSTEGTGVGAAHDTAPQVAGYRLYKKITGRLVNTYDPPPPPPPPTHALPWLYNVNTVLWKLGSGTGLIEAVNPLQAFVFSADPCTPSSHPHFFVFPSFFSFPLKTVTIDMPSGNCESKNWTQPSFWRRLLLKKSFPTLTNPTANLCVLNLHRQASHLLMMVLWMLLLMVL